MNPEVEISGVAPPINITEYARHPALTLRFPFGLNENQSPDVGECGEGYNFDLSITSSDLKPRAPIDLKGTATNGSAITGIMQLVKRDGSQSTLIAAGTTIYEFDGTTWTSKGTITASGKLRGTYWSLGDYLVITDVGLKNVVKKWDGTTFSTLTTGIGTALYAKYGAVFNNRVWLFNITTSSATPHMLLASAFEDPTSYDVSTRGGATSAGGGTFSTGQEAFYLLSPDLKPINGVTVFQNTLLISTENGKTYQLTGSSASDYKFTDFFDGSPSVGDEAMANIGNDVVWMREGGHINRLFSTQYFGNARSEELTLPIPTTISNLDGVNQIVYDKTNQKVLFFVTGKVLVFFKDIYAKYGHEGKSAWSVYTTNDSSNFNTSAAAYIQIPGTTNYSVYWGDSAGRLFDLNGSGAGDAGSTNVAVSRKSRHIGNELINPWPFVEKNIKGTVIYRRKYAFNLTVSVDWDDEYNTTSATLSLKGPPSGDTGVYFGSSNYFGGTIYFNQGFQFANRQSSYNFTPAGKGPGFYITTYASTDGNWQVDRIEFD